MEKNDFYNIKEGITTKISDILMDIQTLQTSGNMEGAEEFLEQLTSIYPDILMEYGLLLHKLSKIGKAIDVFKKIAVISPSSMAFNNLACCYAQMGDIFNAKINCEKAIESDPGNIDAKTNLAGLYYESGQFGDAIKLYEEILKQVPNDTESLLLLSNCYFSQGHYESAIILYQHVLKIDPENEDATRNMAIAQSAFEQRHSPAAV